jgi:putative membrane protein
MHILHVFLGCKCRIIEGNAVLRDGIREHPQKKNPIMPNDFDDTFRSDLWRAIARIESRSRAEVVVLIKPRSGLYLEYSMGAGAVLALAVFTYLMFSPEVFGDFLIYAAPILAFLFGMALVSLTPPLLRRIVGTRRLERTVDLWARASFQKGGLHHTRQETGVLVYVSRLEKQVKIIPDRGIERAIPPVQWERLCADFQGIFSARNPAAALIAELQAIEAVFAQFVPAMENDINELADNLDIEL